jgi:site-specific recombinase XerD
MTMTTNKVRGVFESPKDSGIWHISYFDALGRRHRQKVGRRGAAIEAYHNIKREIREGRFVAPEQQKDSLTLSELAEQALAYKKAHLRPKSYENDRLRWNLLAPTLGALPVLQVTASRIEKHLEALHRSGLSGATVNRYRALFSGIFSYGVRHDLVAFNPIPRVPRFREASGRIRFLEHGEEQSLRLALREECPECEAELDLALHTGMRRGEQFGLKWMNVDLDRGILTVTGKTGRRFLPVNSTARAALVTLYERSNGSAFVSPVAKDDQQRDWRRWFERAVDKAKLENFRWHDLRHTFASRLVMAGVDIRTVQELLGHKTIQMTMRYAHLSQDHKLEAVERLTETKPAARQVMKISA